MDAIGRRSPAGTNAGVGWPGVTVGSDSMAAFLYRKVQGGLGRRCSDLRAVERAQHQVADVGDDLVESEARIRGELLPCGIVAEDIPLGFELGHVGKAEHVSKVGHARADERVTKKDRMESRALEDFELAGVEHFDLADVIAGRGALISAELKHALAFGCRRRGWSDFGPASKGGEEGVFGALKGGRGGSGVPEGVGRLEEFGVGGKLKIEGGELIGGGTRNEHVVGRSFRPDIEPENADGTEAETLQSGNESAGEECLGELELRPAHQVVAAEEVELASRGGGLRSD